MATITTSGTIYKPELVKDLFDKVRGHSTLAKLSASEPVPFSGIDVMTFSMDGEASIVGEGQKKPAGEADTKPTTIKPIKFVYQHRVTDEFYKMSAEKQLPILNSFNSGFAKKIARGFDIAAFHGVNPSTNEASEIVGNNCFDKLVTNVITYDSAAPDDNIDAAAAVILTSDGVISGIAMSSEFGAALGAMKMADSHAPMYPEFRFGANPGSFGGINADVNGTVSFGSSPDRAIVGDFADAFRWGYAQNMTFEIIPYGDPDGQGDLKQHNQIVLRGECYVGWGILDKDSFARIAAGG